MGDLATTLSGLNTVVSFPTHWAPWRKTFANTPPDLKRATEGVARFAQALDAHDAQLRKLLENANKSTHRAGRAHRSDRRPDRRQQRAAGRAAPPERRARRDLRQHLVDGHAAAWIHHRQQAAAQARARQAQRPADHRQQSQGRDQRRIASAQPVRTQPGRMCGLGAVSSTPTSPICFRDNSFSPSSTRRSPTSAWTRTPCCPRSASTRRSASPAPRRCRCRIPRTGQGGEPRLNLPDAITGKPGDPRYPYRPPPPAPPPGGPPPGPPAPAPPDMASTPNQTPRADLSCPAPHEGSRRRPREAGDEAPDRRRGPAGALPDRRGRPSSCATRRRSAGCTSSGISRTATESSPATKSASSVCRSARSTRSSLSRSASRSASGTTRSTRCPPTPKPRSCRRRW